MTYTAQHTCKIKTAAKGPRRVHELDLATGKSLCARKNDAAASNTFTPDRGPGEVECLRCAGMTGH
jgi:hypothetical protein